MDFVQYLIDHPGTPRRLRGDQAAALITKIIGPNALTDDELHNVLAIVHQAFENPDRIPPTATLAQAIGATINYVSAR